jgi:hypothetical protein
MNNSLEASLDHNFDGMNKILNCIPLEYSLKSKDFPTNSRLERHKEAYVKTINKRSTILSSDKENS